MIAVGDRLTRDDKAEFDVVGVHGSAWLLSPVEFGSVERVTGRVLAERFDVAARAPQRGDERAGQYAMLEAQLDAARRAEPGRHALADAHRAQSIALAQAILDEQETQGAHHQS